MASRVRSTPCDSVDATFCAHENGVAASFVVPMTSTGGEPGPVTGCGVLVGVARQVAHIKPAHAKYGPKWRARVAAWAASASYASTFVSTGWSRQLIALDASGLIVEPGASPR